MTQQAVVTSEDIKDLADEFHTALLNKLGYKSLADTMMDGMKAAKKKVKKSKVTRRSSFPQQSLADVVRKDDITRSIASVIKMFLKHKESDTPSNKIYVELTARMEILANITEGIDIEGLSLAVVKKLVTKLKKYPTYSNKKEYKGLSADQLIGLKDKPVLSPSTVKTYINNYSDMYKFAMSKGFTVKKNYFKVMVSTKGNL